MIQSLSAEIVKVNQLLQNNTFDYWSNTEDGSYTIPSGWLTNTNGIVKVGGVSGHNTVKVFGVAAASLSTAELYQTISNNGTEINVRYRGHGTLYVKGSGSPALYYLADTKEFKLLTISILSSVGSNIDIGFCPSPSSYFSAPEGLYNAYLEIDFVAAYNIASSDSRYSTYTVDSSSIESIDNVIYSLEKQWFEPSSDDLTLKIFDISESLYNFISSGNYFRIDLTVTYLRPLTSTADTPINKTISYFFSNAMCEWFAMNDGKSFQSYVEISAYEIMTIYKDNAFYLGEIVEEVDEDGKITDTYFEYFSQNVNGEYGVNEPISNVCDDVENAVRAINLRNNIPVNNVIITNSLSGDSPELLDATYIDNYQEFVGGLTRKSIIDIYQSQHTGRVFLLMKDVTQQSGAIGLYELINGTTLKYLFNVTNPTLESSSAYLTCVFIKQENLNGKYDGDTSFECAIQKSSLYPGYGGSIFSHLNWVVEYFNNTHPLYNNSYDLNEGSGWWFHQYIYLGDGTHSSDFGSIAPRYLGWDGSLYTAVGSVDNFSWSSFNLTTDNGTFESQAQNKIFPVWDYTVAEGLEPETWIVLAVSLLTGNPIGTLLALIDHSGLSGEDPEAVQQNFYDRFKQDCSLNATGNIYRFLRSLTFREQNLTFTDMLRELAIISDNVYRTYVQSSNVYIEYRSRNSLLNNIGSIYTSNFMSLRKYKEQTGYADLESVFYKESALTMNKYIAYLDSKYRDGVDFMEIEYFGYVNAYAGQLCYIDDDNSNYYRIYSIEYDSLKPVTYLKIGKVII